MMPAGTTRNARGIIHRAADDKQVTVLIGLDLSMAFDTVDHRLRLEFGMMESPLNLLQSYLEGRNQLSQHRSHGVDVGVPQ